LKKIILASFALILFYSCSKKSTIETGLEELGINHKEFNSTDTTFYKNKKIQSLRFFKKKTEYTEVFFYESGKKKSIYRVKENQCDGKYIDWFENGKEKWVRQYINGNQIGTSVTFRENGSLEKQFDNNTNEMTDCWGNGKTKFKFIENKLQYYYYFNGNLFEKYDFGKDKYNAEYFNENGKTVFSGMYKKYILYKDNTKYNGKIICYFNNGKISHYEEFVNGMPNGKCYGCYGNGILKFDNVFENGKEIVSKQYYENGKIHLIRDKQNKKFTEWDKNSKLIK
jgi:antitoxin component YwqK of YwqJK toxin-antitoxin module